MSRKRIIALAVILVAIAVLVIVNIKMSYEPSADVEATAVVAGRIVETVSGPGLIYAESSVKVSSSVMGRIDRLAVKEGQRVREGELLVQIDASQYEARLAQAEAFHKAALARMNLAEARRDEAREEMERNLRLFESDLVSQRDVEAAKTSYTVSKAEFEASRETAREADAALRAAEDDFAKTTITSPIRGTVTSLNVEEGEIVITGTMNNPGTVMMTISNLDTMEVRAEIDETDIARVLPGNEVDISVDAFPDTVLRGLVTVVGSSSSSARSMAARPDERSTFDVRVRIQDYLPGLRPGMTTTVDITTAVRDSVTYVPLQALVLREVGEGEEADEREGVFAVEDGRAKFKPVRVGISDDKNVEIYSDLADDGQVIVGPFKVLRDLEDDTKVKIVKESE